MLSSSFKGYPLQVRHKQIWGREFILLLPQTAALPGSNAASDVIKPASSFVIQNRQTCRLIHLMLMRLTRTSVTPLTKQPKRLSHEGIEITIFRVGMQSVNLSIKPFCSLLRETTQVWLLQLCLPSLTESGGINGPRGSSEH